jgi:hypothetical protein
MKKNHKHNKDTNTHNDNGIVLHVSKDYIANTSEEELADVFSGIGASLKEIVEPSDNHNMCDCASCDLASECNEYRTEPYDSDIRQAADEEDYIDSVQYPLDPYINPTLLKTRNLENEYDYMVRRMADMHRSTNETIVNMLSQAHKMEMATLLEYLTQESAVTTQIIIDTIDTVLSNK